MKLLLVHRYFWPDAPPYAHMLLDIGRRLVQDGHEVDVLSSLPSYLDRTSDPTTPWEETVDGVRIRRLRFAVERKSQKMRRLLNAGLFLVRVGWHVLRNRYDLVTFSTMPPVMLGWTVRFVLALKGTPGRYLYHCQDIYPEMALHAGLINAGPWYRLLRRIDRKTCEQALAVVVLSEDMRRTMQLRGLSCNNVHVLNNFSLAEPESPRSPVLSGQDFVVLFAGNLGRFQALDVVIDAARLLESETRIQFRFLGDGVALERLRERAGDLVGRTVHFFPYVPPRKAFELMQEADLGLVTLEPGVIRFAYPSKTMTYLAAGCRILVAVDESCELTRLVCDHDLGVWCRRYKPDRLAALIRQEAARPDRDGRREILRDFASRWQGKAVVLERWAQLFRHLELETQPHGRPEGVWQRP